MKPAALLAVLLLVTGKTVGAEPALELTRVLFLPAKTLVSLRDRETGASQWLEPRQTFGALTFVSYDADQKTAVVTRAGATFRLRLTEAAEAADLQQRSPAERRAVWDRIKDLEGQALVEALVRNDDHTMQSIVKKIHESSLRLKASRTQVAEALAQPSMRAKGKAALQETDRELVTHTNESHTLLVQSAVALKSLLKNSLGL